MYTDEDIVKKVRIMLNELLGAGYSYYEIAIMVDVNDKTVYKWKHGSVPKATQYVNLSKLCAETKKDVSE